MPHVTECQPRTRSPLITLQLCQRLNYKGKGGILFNQLVLPQRVHCIMGCLEFQVVHFNFCLIYVFCIHLIFFSFSLSFFLSPSLSPFPSHPFPYSSLLPSFLPFSFSFSFSFSPYIYMSGTALASKNMQKCQKTVSQKTSVQISVFNLEQLKMSHILLRGSWQPIL